MFADMQSVNKQSYESVVWKETNKPAFNRNQI